MRKAPPPPPQEMCVERHRVKVKIEKGNEELQVGEWVVWLVENQYKRNSEK